MCRAIVKPVLYLLVALLGVAAVPTATIAADRYDVSYLWHRDVTSALDYRERVARVLGPGVSKDLKVVANADLFGLVYTRRGDSAGAAKVARNHTRLLKARGLEAAAPVRSRDWALPGNHSASSASVNTPSVPRSKMTTSERDREIRDVGAAVEDYIKRLRREGKLASDERTGWSVYDFTTGEKLVTINEDVQFQAASLVKPFIAAAFFHKVEQGELVGVGFEIEGSTCAGTDVGRCERSQPFPRVSLTGAHARRAGRVRVSGPVPTSASKTLSRPSLKTISAATSWDASSPTRASS